MRVLLTIHDFLPTARGGSELYVYYLAQQLQELGHEVHILHSEPGEGFSVERRVFDGLTCTVVRKPCRRSPIGVPSEADALVDDVFCRLLREFRPEVIHVNHLLFLSTNLCRIGREHSIPVVFTLHDYWLMCSRTHLVTATGAICSGPGPTPKKCIACTRQAYSRWRIWDPGERGTVSAAKRVVKNAIHFLKERPALLRFLRERNRRLAEIVESTSVFICPSQFLLEMMRQHGLPAGKLVHSQLGMPTRVFVKAPATLRKASSKRRLRFGYLGGFSPLKGIDVLLQAFEGCHDAELIIYGRSSSGHQSAYAHVLSQENVDYRGVVTDEHKAAAFTEFDALVMPSICYENSPLVIQEAFLAGLPVITSNAGGMAELVRDGVCGLQFKLGDASDLRAKLSQLSANPGEVERLRQSIPEVKSIAEQTRAVVEIYRRAIDGLSKHPSDTIRQV
jgi:glycosyltransferase involved in cell wall biosynthesis